jgi:hypothetical protein
LFGPFLIELPTTSLHLSSSNDTIIGTKGEEEGGAGMGQLHLEGLKKNGKMGQNIKPIGVYGKGHENELWTL